MKIPTIDECNDLTRTRPVASQKLMSRRLAQTALAIAASLLVICASSGTARAQQATPSSQVSATASKKLPDILLPAPLTTALDSKKKKTGDEVVLKSVAIVHLADGRLIPRGAKIVGHVTESKVKSGDAMSTLGIAIDKIDLADGKTLPVTGMILAIAPNPNPSDSEGNDGVNYGGMNQTLQHATASAGGTDKVIPILTEDSVGVQGIKNLQLSDGVFKSDQKSLKLGFGSQILVKAQAMAGS